jgi:hypothetical protein
MKLPRRTCVYCKRPGRRNYQLVFGSRVHYECVARVACSLRRARFVRAARRKATP